MMGNYDGLDYEVDLSQLDDQYAHHFAPIEKEMAHYFQSIMKKRYF